MTAGSLPGINEIEGLEKRLLDQARVLDDEAEIERVGHCNGVLLSRSKFDTLFLEIFEMSRQYLLGILRGARSGGVMPQTSYSVLAESHRNDGLYPFLFLSHTATLCMTFLILLVFKPKNIYISVYYTCCMNAKLREEGRLLQKKLLLWRIAAGFFFLMAAVVCVLLLLVAKSLYIITEDMTLGQETCANYCDGYSRPYLLYDIESGGCQCYDESEDPVEYANLHSGVEGKGVK